MSRSSICSTPRRRIRAASSSLDLADEAPTLHLYVVDEASDCEHPRWRDPLFDEWLDAGVVARPARAALIPPAG